MIGNDNLLITKQNSRENFTIWLKTKIKQVSELSQILVKSMKWQNHLNIIQLFSDLKLAEMKKIISII